jgi:large repetitive protein
MSGGSLGWTKAVSVTVTGGGSTDTGSGVASYQYRTSTDGGQTWSAAVTGTTLDVKAAGTTLVQFRATDVSGQRSAWAPSPATAGSIVNIDRTAPSAPAVSGGSPAWQNVSSITVTAAGGSDTGGAGLATPQYRTSTDGGTTWSAATAAAIAAVTAEGETLVQFRNVDAAGNTSAWAPAAATAGSTVRLDRTAPSAPSVSGGSLTCTITRTISAAGSSDGSGSGVSHYEYEVSTDGGTTYGAAATGHTVTFTTSGSYVVQFRAVDGVGLASAWAPASPGAADTACIT